ncbi:MAG TPA: acylneuraminate cytidylyltransferase family protein [Stellaceae bacterium]|nr:acylneuraminate cytidylyltransferase family protein [Stellaceae bacterium]
MICARAGSKGVRSKNTRLIAGKPLIAHSLDQARASGLFDAIAVSSDSEQLLSIAHRHGATCLVQRPDALANDTAAKLPAMRHCLENVERQIGTAFDVVVDLDATSPLRLPEDIRAVVSLLEQQPGANVITGAPARRSPYFNLVERRADGTVGLSKPPASAIVRRQDAPECFDMNASIYAWWAADFRAGAGVFGLLTRLHVMPEERSLDIDSELDFRLVEFLLESRTAAAAAE